MTGDRNFDDLAEKFARKVYGGLKGDIRLAVIWRDLLAAMPELEGGKSLRILDIGGGMGQIAIRLAGLGHQLLVNDLSSEMLQQGEAEAQRQGLAANIQWQNGPYQALGQELHGQFDLVLCHALIEWLAEPQALIPVLKQFLKPDGKISLTFYNQHALEYRNLIRGNFNMLDRTFSAHPGSLTPGTPLLPEQIDDWLERAELQLIASSGIRVFHDYVTTARGGHQIPEAVVARELLYSTKEPFKWLGRYIHYLIKHP